MMGRLPCTRTSIFAPSGTLARVVVFSHGRLRMDRKLNLRIFLCILYCQYRSCRCCHTLSHRQSYRCTGLANGTDVKYKPDARYHTPDVTTRVCPTSTRATVDTGKVGRGTCCAVRGGLEWKVVVVRIGPKYGSEGEPCASPTGLGGSVPLRVPQTPLPPKRGGSPWSGVRHGCPSHSLRAYVGVPVSGTCCIVRVQENVGGGGRLQVEW